MALRRLYATDEELGKRDDDFRPKRRPEKNSFTMQWRKRRYFAILIFLVLAYFFVTNIPADLGPADLRLRDSFRPHKRPPLVPPEVATQKEQVDVGQDGVKPPAAYTTLPIANTEPTGAPPRTGSVESELLIPQYYDGPIRFYRLVATLNAVRTTMSSATSAGADRSVLFAVSSLKSLANLLPLACEMSRHKTNLVHIAIMSRETLSLEELKALNNVNQDDCDKLVFHDARADFSEYSTDARHEGSVAGSMYHINTAINPHAIIVDDENVEDLSFSRAIRARAKSLFKTLIEIPARQYEAYRYICWLDYKSLEHWHAPNVEIVVHARKGSAGGLIKLLRTLAAADYELIRLPKLTIDLATTIPQALQTFLNNFKWLPRIEPATLQVDPVQLRHHVQSQQLTSEQAALRFVESFYPASFDHHVLLLSPQVELSPHFYRYLHYAILQYKYSVPKHHRFGDLFGISLDVPTLELDGERPFVAPEVDEEVKSKEELKTSFLYQAPSSSSMLVFGDKWATFHNYLTNRLEAGHTGKSKKVKKVVSETEPAWMEYLLELMRAREWLVLYPARSFGTVHNELAQLPEEFTREEQGIRPPLPTDESSLEEPFLLGPADPTFRIRPEEELANPLTPLHEVLPLGGQLPGFSNLPFLAHTGELIDLETYGRLKVEYLAEFRKQIGGCEEEEARRPRLVEDGKTDDLFCLPGLDVNIDFRAEDASKASSNDHPQT